jgi:hypothetical protein
MIRYFSIAMLFILTVLVGTVYALEHGPVWDTSPFYNTPEGEQVRYQVTRIPFTENWNILEYHAYNLTHRSPSHQKINGWYQMTLKPGEVFISIVYCLTTRSYNWIAVTYKDNDWFWQSFYQRTWRPLRQDHVQKEFVDGIHHRFTTAVFYPLPTPILYYQFGITP